MIERPGSRHRVDVAVGGHRRGPGDAEATGPAHQPAPLGVGGPLVLELLVEQGPEGVVQPGAGHQHLFAQQALAHEAQFLRHPFAGLVPHRHPQHHPVQAHLVEGHLEHASRRFGGDPPAGLVAAHPVAHFTGLLPARGGPHGDVAQVGEAVRRGAQGEVVSPPLLPGGLAVADEAQSVAAPVAGVGPGQPAAQFGQRGPHRLHQRLGVAAVEGAQGQPRRGARSGGQGPRHRGTAYRLAGRGPEPPVRPSPRPSVP